MLDIRGLDRPSEAIQTRLLSEAGVARGPAPGPTSWVPPVRAAAKIDPLRGYPLPRVHGSAYGVAGEGTLRVSFATGGQNLRSGLSRLRDGLAALE